MKTKSEQLDLLYFRVTDIWKLLCENHNILLTLTCDEYSALLQSDLDKIEELVTYKDVVIAKIEALNELREEVIDDINKSGLSETPIDSMDALIDFMKQLDVEKKEKHLFRFNRLLIDMIDKIKEQNKTNKLFLNKAMHSINDIIASMRGMSNYSTYNAKGSETRKL